MMSTKAEVHQRFPWHIFIRIFFIQAILIWVILGASGITARYFFKRQLLKQVIRGVIPLNYLTQTLHVFDRSLIQVLVLIAFALGLFAVWSGRSLVVPLKRLLAKAKNDSIESDDELGSNTYGEWSDLESSIEMIRRDLYAKSQSLSDEREQQDTLMSAISDGILAVDLRGVPLFYNSRFALLLNNPELQSGNLRLGEMFREPEIREAFQSAMKEGKANSLNAIPFGSVAGGRRFFSISVAPLRKRNGDIYAVAGFFHDVTALKMAEQIRIDFVANVSHELRTPLTAIKGYTETLMQDLQQGRPVEKEFLEVIARNSQRLLNLMNDLLDLSSLESNADFLNKVKLSTEEITSRVIQQMRKMFESKKQEVIVQAQALTIFADPRRLEQVLINLLDNANKYTPSGGTITVSWENLEKEGVLLKVADTGPGIPLEHRQRLFERFYRVDKARSREQGGTGLGLAIVKHIMQRHEGSTWVEGSVGEGAVFICKFPNYL